MAWCGEQRVYLRVVGGLGPDQETGVGFKLMLLPKRDLE